MGVGADIIDAFELVSLSVKNGCLQHLPALLEPDPVVALRTP